MKIKTIIFNFMTFFVFLTPIIHAALLPENPRLLLINAVKNGDLKRVQELIESFSIDPNIARSDGKTLLIIATNKGHFEIVKYLLKIRGINPDLQDKKKQTPLMWLVPVEMRT